MAGRSAALAADRYVATDLGDLPGGIDRSRGFGLNNRGQVVGGSHAGTGLPSPATLERPFLWTPHTPNGTTGSMIDLGLPPDPAYPSGTAVGINDPGQVVIGYQGGGPSRVFLWTPHAPNGSTGTMAEIGNPPVIFVDGDRVAAAINNFGQVVGADGDFAAIPGAFLWTPNSPNGSSGVMADVGPPGGVASGINATGQVIGTVDYAEPRDRSFLWTPSATNATTGTTTDLGVPPGYRVTNAAGMNDSGRVVGTVHGDSGSRAFVWTPDAPNGQTGSMALLPGTATTYSSEARDINNDGEVVGTASGGNDPLGQGAVLWDEEHGMRLLHTLLDQPLPQHWYLTDAVAINDHGQVLVKGLYAPSNDVRPIEHAFLLTPVPEPAGAVLLCLAAGYLLPRHRQGKRDATGHH